MYHVPYSPLQEVSGAMPGYTKVVADFEVFSHSYHKARSDLASLSIDCKNVKESGERFRESARALRLAADKVDVAISQLQKADLVAMARMLMGASLGR
ncbi:hypothetical protein JCM17845_03570 [Iodidimonas gelatinilytica]|uniref:Uncharacterized protein n=1 Tax=Iodidimonas gelatinilytica TaxID=1236966 RepID=A0A5A7MWL9_9PROT|nr:hypothetical protein [Iodidimonas gelatinilytica]GEQ99733.1 hypothetical protein JCM17845_03570 [Iodidimonas gelatinilytica]